jgi:multiple sugar transport system permease protein
MDDTLGYGASSLSRQRRIRRLLRKTLAYIVLIIGSVVMMLPFLWMASTAFKTQAQVMTFPPQWIPRPFTLANFPELFDMLPFGRYFLNSVIVSTSRTTGVVVFAILTAYAFARLHFPGRDQVFVLYLATMMIPFHVRLIPLYLIMRGLHWLDTYWVLIVPPLFSAYGTFLLRQFFMTIPGELEDAAIIDGCNKLQVLIVIIVPLAKAGIATFGTFAFLGAWNEFMYPLIMTSSDKMRVLSVGVSILQNQYYTEYRTLMAASVISVVPVIIIFLVAQNYFIRGIALTGMKS